MRHSPSSALREGHLAGWKGERSNLGAGPEARGVGLGGRVFGFWKQQLRWVQTPRRGGPFLPRASVFRPPSSRRPSRRRWLSGPSVGPRRPRPLFPPAAPQAGPQCCLRMRVGQRRRRRNSLGNFSQRLSKPPQPQLSQPKLRSEGSRWRSLWGKAIVSWWGRRGAPGPCGCSPASPRSHSHCPQTPLRSKFPAPSPFLGLASAGGLVQPRFLGRLGGTIRLRTLHLGSAAAPSSSDPRTSNKLVLWEDEVPSPPPTPLPSFGKKKITTG